MFSSILSVGILAVSGISICFMIGIITYHKLNKSYESPEFESKYGTLLEGVNLQRPLGMYWNSIVLIRWSLTSVIMVILRDYYALQICSLLIISYLIQIMIITYRPLDG